MASLKKRLTENIEGDFYVDSTCINCGTCCQFAPEIFADGGSHCYVFRQPVGAEETKHAMQALVACPVQAIGMKAGKVSEEVLASFPLLVDGDVYVNGYNSASSYGADSYFIRSAEGNWMIDSPRFHPILVRQFQKLGGIQYIFLTHRDDVANADQYAQTFGAKRVIHKADVSAQPDAEIVLDSTDDVLMGQARIVYTPGHTRGHCVLLWQNKYLFTGDHLAWSPEADTFRAFRDYCWYSWKEQIRSVEKLALYSGVGWVLPGHGVRKKIDPGTFPRLIRETVRWMEDLA